MREVISVHVGQAGVQIGNACCKPAHSYIIYRFNQLIYAAGELYTAEHGLGVSPAT